MSVRVDPATLSALTGGIERSTSELGQAQPPASPDLGPSSAAADATVADLLRGTAGYVETLHNGASDLDVNKADYASTDDSNAGLFHNLGQ
ncbi:hypothetical protein [Bounagaea algeriensis]